VRSVIAVIRDGQALVIPDANGNRLHSSVVTLLTTSLTST